ncbi:MULTISPECIES: hypothetical protein [unclassified Pseudodesulfovibrio]|uniref:hypothetical protein n=1 Tax=unclassified Pseudodesulfovibrio TaxID=2661612 RepID=UPI000FEBDA0C|nr:MULTISPECIES: hypothetical protein [unclassified Pseudodesulfovibrio]MCJ2164690.1 hypothetical protein [Pseudodesulfovibrio sp. S3-i]RWU04119.1 hypothetical protein DWB63_08925 [Pseudodesulfovibrio sp. S3]
MKIIQKRNNAIFIPILVVALLALAGCFQNDVDLVKDGTMNGYPTTTIGPAFDASFDGPKWEAFETDKKVRVVEFSGRISQTLHDNYVSNILNSAYLGITPDVFQPFAEAILPEPEYQQVHEAVSGEGSAPRAEVDKALLEAACQKLAPTGSIATFQWTINTDGETFSLSYVDYDAWGPIAVQFPLGTVPLHQDKLQGVLDAIYD